MCFRPEPVFASAGAGAAENYTVILDNTSDTDALIGKYDLNDGIQTVKLDDVVIADAKLTDSEVQKLENADGVLAVDKAITLYGCEESQDAGTEELNQWYLDAINAGILLVASAGNTGQSGVLYPAAYDEVMAVGSSDENGLQSDFTSTGDELELLAPGEKIITMGILDGVASTEGTSLSTAEVSASAAILLSQEGSSRDLVRDLLRASSRNVANSSAGLLDIGYALEIYDDFSENYTSENSGAWLPVNTNRPSSYDADGIISGMWAIEKHQYLVNHTSLTENKNESYLDAALATVALADEEFKDTSDNHSGLHGWGNYYLNLKGIWMYANYIGNGKTVTEASDLVNKVITKNSFKRDDVKEEKREEVIAKDYKCFTNMIAATNKMLNNRSDYGLSAYTTKGEKKYLVVGFAMHLLGDLFAHSSLIPDYAFDQAKDKRHASENSSDHGSYLGMSDFNNWNDVFKLKGQLTFPKLKEHMIPSLRYDLDNPPNKIYEDNVDFCRERFHASLVSCRTLYTEISSAGNSFKPSVIDDVCASNKDDIKLVKQSVYSASLAELSNNASL